MLQPAQLCGLFENVLPPEAQRAKSRTAVTAQGRRLTCSWPGSWGGAAVPEAGSPGVPFLPAPEHAGGASCELGGQKACLTPPTYSST